MGGDGRRVECAFFVPVVRNDNKQPHQPWCWRALQNALYRDFGGDTGSEFLYRGTQSVPGEYEDDEGKRVTDLSRRYIVAVPPNRIDDLRLILRRACNLFVQEAIYLSVAGMVELVHSTENDGTLTL